MIDVKAYQYRFVLHESFRLESLHWFVYSQFIKVDMLGARYV